MSFVWKLEGLCCFPVAAFDRRIAFVTATGLASMQEAAVSANIRDVPVRLTLRNLDQKINRWPTKCQREKL